MARSPDNISDAACSGVVIPFSECECECDARPPVLHALLLHLRLNRTGAVLNFLFLVLVGHLRLTSAHTMKMPDLLIPSPSTPKSVLVGGVNA